MRAIRAVRFSGEHSVAIDGPRLIEPTPEAWTLIKLRDVDELVGAVERHCVLGERTALSDALSSAPITLVDLTEDGKRVKASVR